MCCLGTICKSEKNTDNKLISFGVSLTKPSVSGVSSVNLCISGDVWPQRWNTLTLKWCPNRNQPIYILSWFLTKVQWMLGRQMSATITDLFSLLFISFIRFEGHCGCGLVLIHKISAVSKLVLHMPACVAIRYHQYVTNRRALADSRNRWDWNCKGESCFSLKL